MNRDSFTYLSIRGNKNANTLLASYSFISNSYINPDLYTYSGANFVFYLSHLTYTYIGKEQVVSNHLFDESSLQIPITKLTGR